MIPLSQYAQPIPLTPQQTQLQIQQLVQQELVRLGYVVQEPFDIAKFGQELLVKVGDALSEDKATFLRDNMPHFLKFVSSQSGKENVNFMIDSFQDFLGNK